MSGRQAETMRECPFCGSKSVHQEPLPDFGTRRDERWAATYCNDCHARAVDRGADKQGAYADAARRWNRRNDLVCHDGSRSDDMFICSHCFAVMRTRFPDGYPTLMLNGNVQRARFCPNCGARVASKHEHAS